MYLTILGNLPIIGDFLLLKTVAFLMQHFLEQCDSYNLQNQGWTNPGRHVNIQNVS
jgi:hypothetical protein